MRLDGERESNNVDVASSSGGGGGGFRPIHLSLPLIGLVIVGSLLFHRNPIEVLGAVVGNGQGAQNVPAQTTPASANANEDPSTRFVRKVLASTEDAWGDIYKQSGHTYSAPHLTLYRDQINSACGFSTAAVGPFYCPPDQRVYLDLSFFDEMRAKFGAPGDFAQAYVVAHEIGHHIQKLQGISDRVHSEEARMGEADRDALSVRVELQADCYAGVWGKWAQAHGQLDQGDLEEAIRAASAIGDDTLQRRGRGRVTPETFTHGSSAQRVQWLKRGFDSGRVDACDTFGSNL